MSYFNINVADTPSKSAEMKNVSNKLNRLAEKLGDVSSGNGGAGLQNYVYYNRINTYKRSILNMKRDTAKLAESLEDISNIYRNSENKILQADSSWGNWLDGVSWQILEEIYKQGIIDHTVSEIAELGKKVLEQNWVCSLLSPGISCLAGVGATLEDDSWSSKLKDFYTDITGMKLEDVGVGEFDLKKWGVKDKDRKDKDSFGFDFNKEAAYTYDRKTGKLVKKEDEEDDKKKFDKKDIAESITIYESKYSFLDDDKGIVIGTTEHGSTITFGKKDAYIKHKLTAGSFEASVGGAYSLLSFEVPEQSWGIFHGSGKVDVGSASGQAEFSAGWLNEDGGFDPHLDASLSAEVTLVSAEGTVGVDILGTDVDVTGSVGVGLGGHFDVGINDGVLTLDMGAYVGLGGDIKLEINVGETVEKAVDFAEDVYCGVTDAIGDGFDYVGGKLEDLGNWIGSWW